MSFLCCVSSMAFREPDISLSLDPSATSLLDGQLLDQSGKMLYQIETANEFTKITPAHSSQGRRSGGNTVMSIRWPQRFTVHSDNGNTKVSAPDALVTVNGETTAAKRLLRRRKLVTDGKSHKFRIDGYKPTFRWKRKSRQYLLFVSGNRQPIAYLSSDQLTATFRLEIYGSHIPSYHAQDQPGLVSSILLDHIVLTSLLLVTPPLEWRRVCGATATRTSMATSASSEYEEPTTIVHHGHPPRQQRQAMADPFDDSCAAPSMRETSRAFPFPPSTAYTSIDNDSVELMRRPSHTSTSSSRTLVQSLVRTVLASISSDDSSLFATTEDSSSYYGASVASQAPPPPYQRNSSSRR